MCIGPQYEQHQNHIFLIRVASSESSHFDQAVLLFMRFHMAMKSHTADLCMEWLLTFVKLISSLTSNVAEAPSKFMPVTLKHRTLESWYSRDLIFMKDRLLSTKSNSLQILCHLRILPPLFLLYPDQIFWRLESSCFGSFGASIVVGVTIVRKAYLGARAI